MGSGRVLEVRRRDRVLGLKGGVRGRSGGRVVLGLLLLLLLVLLLVLAVGRGSGGVAREGVLLVEEVGRGLREGGLDALLLLGSVVLLGLVLLGLLLLLLVLLQRSLLGEAVE